MAYRRPVTKRQEERFTKSLTDTREMLDSIIEKAQERDEGTFDELENFSKAMERIYRHAERMERDDE